MMEALWISFAKLFFLAAAQIGTWWILINMVNKSIGRDTASDYEECKNGNYGHAIIRAAIIIGVAYMVNGAYSRWV